MRIEKSVILVTGGSSGIGKAMAEYLSNMGGKIYICDIQSDLGNKIENESQGKIKFIKCNVCNEEEVKSMVDQIYNESGRIDVLINNAGISGIVESVKDDMTTTIENFDKIYRINVYGVFLVSKYVAQKMIKCFNKETECNGCIIMISSIMGLHGMKGLTSYSASKGALIGMTLPMARDLGKYKIRVNSICPGLIPTPLIENIKGNILSVKNSTPIKRLGQTYEIAQACESLIINDFINGTIIKVDGGIVANF
jgi:NAD(P)-dependent dehydrogenase (short-subunit alcohol dehydrogenase family)